MITTILCIIFGTEVIEFLAGCLLTIIDWSKEWSPISMIEKEKRIDNPLWGIDIKTIGNIEMGILIKEEFYRYTPEGREMNLKASYYPNINNDDMIDWEKENKKIAEIEERVEKERVAEMGKIIKLRRMKNQLEMEIAERERVSDSDSISGSSWDEEEWK